MLNCVAEVTFFYFVFSSIGVLIRFYDSTIIILMHDRAKVII